MTVGIPGTGLGGLFYILLVVLMPFREVVLTIRRRSSLARWRRVAFHLMVLVSIFGVLWVEGWLLDRALALFTTAKGTAPVRDFFLQTGQVAAIASFVVLAVLLAGVTALSFTPLAARGAGRRAGTPRLGSGRSGVGLIGSPRAGTNGHVALGGAGGRLLP
jgi:hypothetical protein